MSTKFVKKWFVRGKRKSMNLNISRRHKKNTRETWTVGGGNLRRRSIVFSTCSDVSESACSRCGRSRSNCLRGTREERRRFSEHCSKNINKIPSLSNTRFDFMRCSRDKALFKTKRTWCVPRVVCRHLQRKRQRCLATLRPAHVLNLWNL